MKKIMMVLITVCLTLAGLINQVKAQQLYAYISTTDNKVEFCTNQSISLIGEGVNGTGNYVEHRWTIDHGKINYTKDNIASLNISESGIYIVSYIVKDDDGNEAIASLRISILKQPYGELEFDGSRITLTGIDDSSIKLYRWLKDGKDIQSFVQQNNISKGSYRVVLTNNNGCSFTTKAIKVF